jgi:predicted metal-binding membrane protein
MFAEATLPRRTEITIVVGLGVLTIAAWLLTIRLMGPAMSGGMVGAMISPGLLAALDVGMWVAMMAAMMLPSTAPVLAAVGQIARSRKQQSVSARAPWVFGLGYLLVWLAVGVVAATIDLGGRAVLGGSPSLSAAAPVGAGVVLALAGLYQVSPLKNVCLRHCRSPFGFLMTNWREGTIGAIGLGIRHGVYCLGCCWALMVTLLVAEPLGIAWPITLSLLILVEKALPGGRQVAVVAAVGLVVLGIAQATGLVMLVSPSMT